MISEEVTPESILERKLGEITIRQGQAAFSVSYGLRAFYLCSRRRDLFHGCSNGMSRSFGRLTLKSSACRIAPPHEAQDGGTLARYDENPPDLTVGKAVILFLDLGPVFEEWEADFGRTFVLGSDPVKLKLSR